MFRLLKESQGIDPRREMVDMLNKDRLNENIAAYQSNYNSCLPTHKKDHDQHHLETTYGKDYVHPHPELLNVKSEKTVKKITINLIVELNLEISLKKNKEKT